MEQQFKEQGGVATMDPGPIRRWITSKLMTAMSGEARQFKQRKKAEENRLRNGERHQLEYFHQIDDGYSHLAAQILQQFSQRYDVEMKCHLVDGAAGNNAPEPELLLKLSRYDSFHIAPYYGLEFPKHDRPIDPQLCQKALAILASALGRESSNDFISNVADIGRALWSEDIAQIEKLEQTLGHQSDDKVRAALDLGNSRRKELKHYSGAMFYYAGEWYWGVDRLYHLEQRLIDLGLDKAPGEPLIAPRPALETGPLKDAGRLTLEIYPSLRSPYTAVVFDQTVALAEKTGVNLKVLPVLPMVMRGVPATREKGMYILFDAGREARAAGVPFGPCYDPIGEPSRRAYSLLAWAAEQGKAAEFFSSFLKCAWVDAINTNNDKGMQKVVERAGLDWAAAKLVIGNSAWEDVLETNRQAMYELGLWGVPSYRLVDEQGETLLALWGQDRLWIISKEIQRTLRADSKTGS